MRWEFDRIGSDERMEIVGSHSRVSIPKVLAVSLQEFVR